jgi:hypothetical protein
MAKEEKILKTSPAKLAAAHRYREKTKDRMKEYQRTYREKTKEKKAEYFRLYREENKAGLIAKAKEYYARNKEIMAIKKRNCPSATPEKRSKANAEYRAENREKLKAIRATPEYRADHAARVRKLRATSALACIRGRLAGRLNHAMRTYRTEKSASTLRLVGCTREKLRAYLESTLPIGMTLKMALDAGFHVDHIRPCASFDLTDEEQRRACFHYTNLQMLPSAVNRSKNSKWNGKYWRTPRKEASREQGSVSV